jgi:hypothetical protein
MMVDDYDDYDEFDSYGVEHSSQFQYLGAGQQQFTSGESGSQKKSALPGLRLPMLVTAAPAETQKTQELPAELHTQKTVQPIVQTRTIVQPIIQQRLIEQPILRTRLLIQPMHRWIETQPVIQPKIIQNTRLIRQYQEQPVIVPKLIERTQVQQTYQSKPRTLQTQTNKPQYVNNPVQTSKAHLPALQAQNQGEQMMRNLGLNPNIDVQAALQQQQPIQQEQAQQEPQVQQQQFAQEPFKAEEQLQTEQAQPLQSQATQQF